MSNKNSHLKFKALDNTIKQLKLKYAWFTKHSVPVYTYFRENYGSRLDRFYVGEIQDSIQNIVVNNISFSDHAAVILSLSLDEIGRKGNFYWKLNTSLLDSEEVINNFKEFWQQLKRKIYSFTNICDWWEKK